MATKTAVAKSRRSNATKVCVVATNAAYAKLCKQSIKRLPTRDRSHFELQSFAGFAEVRLPSGQGRRTLFVSRLADLPKEGIRLTGQSEAKHLLIVEGLPIEAMAARLPMLNVRTPDRLHLAAGRSSERIVELVYRLFSGITNRNGPQPIVDAWIENEQLVLLSASFERMTVPLEKLSEVLGANIDDIEAFEIDEDGSFLFWPHADAHIGLEQFRQLIDPTAALAAKQRSEAFNRRYGAAIRTLREDHGVKQSDVEGITERHLRRIEHGEQAASKAILQSLADAVDLSLEDCLKELASRSSTSARA